MLLGHKDLIDNLLYAAAVVFGVKFLMVDKDLANFVSQTGLPSEHIMFPEEL